MFVMKGRWALLLIAFLVVSKVAWGDGFKGLNLVPVARHYETDTLVLQADYNDPYAQMHIGYQLLDSFYVGLRQTFELSSLRDDADRVYPGVDMKLRLLRETRTFPEISLGWHSAVGHRRMAGEYLAFSKRFYDFDLSGGLGWGRFGSSGHLKNPFTIVSSHFGRARRLSGENPNGPEDWFTGKDVGLFAGVAYETPIEGVRLTAEYGGDRFVEEAIAIDGYETPSPFSLGVDYSYEDWANVGLVLRGGNKVMGRLTFTPSFGGAEKKNVRASHSLTRIEGFSPENIEEEAERSAVELFDVRGQYNEYSGQPESLSAGLMLRGDLSAPAQVEKAAAMMSKRAGLNVETLIVEPYTDGGIRGASLVLNRRDLENAARNGAGGRAQIWKNVRYEMDSSGRDCKVYCLVGASSRFATVLENKLSLSEEENGFVYRSSVISGWRGTIADHLVGAISLRLNLFHNLDDSLRFQTSRGAIIRDHEDAIADQRLRLDRAYMQWLDSYGGTLFTAISAGYLDEKYSGLSFEILNRPFRKRFAYGAELHGTLERYAYGKESNLSLSGLSAWSGLANFYYEWADDDVTLAFQAGRFLAGDVGLTSRLSKRFDNGARMEGFVTATDMADVDLFGGTTHVNAGLRFVKPLNVLDGRLGQFKADTRIEPFSRYAGQAVKLERRLYDISEPLSFRHQALNWED